MNILFVSFNGIEDSKFGGGQCSRRNYELLSKFGKTTVISISKMNNISSLLSLLTFCFPPLSRKKNHEVANYVIKENIEYIFIDSSLMGSLIKLLHYKTKNKKIIVFFHNVEKDYIDVRMKKGIKNFVYKYLAMKEEILSVKYADCLITLNERDRKRIESLYGRSPEYLMPISFDDKYAESKVEKDTKKKIGLFVGALGRANYEGVKWFVENSSTLSDYEFQIVGKDFEKVKKEFSNYPVNIIGTVEDISKYYENADFIVSPILFGGGMKVKTAEALMYGKTVFGTQEALEGYEIRNDDTLILCNSIEEFDCKIRKYIKEGKEKFNEKSRELFMERYSTGVMEDKMKTILLTFGEGYK